MGQPVSDAAVEILGVCRHSLRFSFGAPLDYPYTAARPADDNPPPVLFRRVQVSSPPPPRDGAPWTTGLMTNGGDLDPSSPPADLGAVRAREGAVALDMPEPETIVLDWWFSVPRARETMTFPGTDGDRYFLSVPYWTPATTGSVTRDVAYFATHRLKWAQTPASEWIAVSFDGFFPPERDSADLIAKLGPCDGLCPPD
jgi:hypothetical protein